MSDYEIVNQRSAARRAARRKDAFRRLSFCLGIVLAFLLAWIGLEYIGFINVTFMVILAAATLCVGSFKAGYICRDVKY